MLGVDEGMGVEEAAVAFCSLETAIGIVSISDVVGISTDADMVELLVVSEAVLFRRPPPTIVEMVLIVGVNVSAIL